MRKLDEEDKQIIRNINNVKDGEIKTVSSLIIHLFKADRFALLMYDKVYLLIEQNEDSAMLLFLMAKISSLIDFLRREGYLYLIPNKDYFFLQDGFNSSVIVNTYGDISCSRGNFERDGSSIKLVANNQSFVSINIPEKFEEALKMIVCNFVYPTAKLHELIKNDFAFGDELRYKIELQYTKCGLFISLLALLIAIGAPFYMTEYNNKHAITTINSTQFNKIERAIQKKNSIECTDNQLTIKKEIIGDTVITLK